MKQTKARPYSDPATASRKLVELATSIEAINGHIHIEKINAPCRGGLTAAAATYHS
ncbi:hypothetical protein AB4Z51_37440 [Bradyrhizobium sp. 2TAF36]|uniref:hypothetical protein n=1 Tax=Bradyrhizobium sp. 2TAF36 TaxID=3233016 RepID=UPI003F8F9C20